MYGKAKPAQVLTIHIRNVTQGQLTMLGIQLQRAFSRIKPYRLQHAE